MSPRAHWRPSDELVLLAEACCNGTLSGDQSEELEQRLLADADARAYFRRHMALDAALRDHGASAAVHWLGAKRPAAGKLSFGASGWTWTRNESRWANHLPLCAAGLAAIALGVFAASARFGPAPAEAKVIATLEQVTGDVRVLAANGRVRSIVADAAIRLGDTVRTSGSESATVVAYPDGTRLTLVGDTSATCGDSHSKSFVIHHGTLAASVEPQPSASPMLLATPTAQVEVLGTKFLIEAVANRTDLSVTEGRVRLVRVRDGEVAEVAVGRRVIVNEQEKMLVEDIPRLPAAWEVDFEGGLPPDWEVGEYVTQNLLRPSRGAVRAARHVAADGETYYAIASGLAWSQGLFDVGKDSHIHLTLKMDNPKWLNLLLVTRTDDPRNPRFCSNFIFTEFPKIPPGKWLTISIPLAGFRKLHDGPETLDQLVPYKVIFNSTAPDRGLVIDRLWVTPDGPGEVRVLEAE